jgi:hypothetical protein
MGAVPSSASKPRTGHHFVATKYAAPAALGSRSTRARTRARTHARTHARTLPLDLRPFNTVLGVGGFGKVVRHDVDPTVVKLYYSAGTCAESAKEFAMLQRAFDAIAPFFATEQIYVPRPIAFANFPHYWGDESFACVLELGLLGPVPGFRGIVHIVLKEDYKGMVDREIGKNPAKPVSDENPARGFFATGSLLDAAVLPGIDSGMKGALRTSAEIAHRFGFLYGMLVAAGMYPFDVEFALGVVHGQLHVVALDFNLARVIPEGADPGTIAYGLVNGLDGVAGAYSDLYVPYVDDPTWPNWQKGVQAAAAVALPGSAAILDAFLTEYAAT